MQSRLKKSDSSASQQQQPNIIYVFPNQFRNQAMAFWNEPEFSSNVGWKADPVHTPNLDSFAKESVVLSHAATHPYTVDENGNRKYVLPGQYSRLQNLERYILSGQKMVMCVKVGQSFVLKHTLEYGDFAGAVVADRVVTFSR